MSTRLFTKENMVKLTKDERSRLMLFQMSPRYGPGSDYLPEDSSECTVCGYPMLGSGRCRACYKDFAVLETKARA